MEKFIKICGILFLVSFFSCNKNDIENEVVNVLNKKPSSITITNSDGISLRYNFYYSDNRITKITYNSKGGREFTYDSKNRLKKIEYSSSGDKVNYYYYSDNKLSLIEYSLSRGYKRSVSLYYNSSNQVNKSVTNNNNENEVIYYYNYDSLDRPTERIDKFGNSEKYQYDNANNPFKNVYPQMNESMLFGHWIKGLKNNLLTNDNLYGEELTYEYEYDKDNYPISIKEFSSGTVNYNYRTIITYE